MLMITKQKQVIGRSTKISFPDAGIVDLPAKVDTGAYSSAIWATNIKEKDGKLHFTLLGPSSTHYSGRPMSTKRFKVLKVQNSFGHCEDRYLVRLKVEVAGETHSTLFTLANRHIKSYSALIGRRLLRDNYLVDVSFGVPRQRKAFKGN